MKRATLTTLALLLSSTLLVALPVAGYHWDDENENTEYMSFAGDEAVIRDGGECFNQTAQIEDAHCVVLYGHVFDLLNTVPMNVQSPATCSPDLARGFSGDPVHLGNRNHMELFSSPGFVEYTEDVCGGIGQEEPRTHPERLLSSDIRIEEDVPIYGYWYLSADSGEFSPLGVNSGQGESSAGIMPCVSVRMQLWTERYPGSGTLLAEGTTTKTVVTTPQAADDPEEVHGLVDEVCEGATGTVDPQKVTEFQVAMEQLGSLIPGHEAYVISVDWFQYDGEDPDAQPNLMQKDWNLHTGSEYPNRVVMAVKDSIRIEELRLVEFSNKLWIRGSANTPWGSYDVDTENIRLSLYDEDGQEIPLEHLDDPLLVYSTDHHGHYKPVNVTYAWDYKQQDLPPGDYTFRLTVTNWQHTHDATAERTFTLQDGTVDTKGGKKPEMEGRESPVHLVVFAALLLIVPLLRVLGRRRDA